MIEARLPRPLPFDPSVLAERFGTPLYVYDLDAVAARVRTLREHLPDRFVLAYAVKANPALAVVARIGGLGVGMDVASAGELATVLRAGVSPDEIVFTGPGKRDDELLAALQARIRAVTVESLGELHRLETLASARGQVMPVLVRAAITGPREGRRIIGGPGARKFGMRLPDVRRAARLAARSSSLELLGLHAFGASNVRDGGTLVRHIRRTVELGRDVAAGAGVPLRLVDVGGGLGIPY
ncbi:MAG TPA: alanine racemase, partial [Candidatus Limnocylindrales bacterium]